MSLMTDSRESADSCTIVRCSRWVGVRSVSSTSSVMPMTAFIGVRISWLMFARKLLLARLAASAASLACSSSRFACFLFGDVVEKRREQILPKPASRARW